MVSDDQARDRSWDQGSLTRPLVAFGGEQPPAPDWFMRAQALPFERKTFAVAGCELELLCWGETGRPGVLLLHGSMAHAQWWAGLAPMLAKDYRVCSLSFSGMGGSGHRDRYAVSQMAQEGWAAMEAGGLLDTGARPLVVAHSFGGKAACLMAGGPGGERLLGTILVDSFVIPDRGPFTPPPYRSRLYASQADALARFRLSPDQPGGEPFVIDAVARAGLKELPDGQWTWRFDPDFFQKLDYQNGWDELKQARCRLAFIRGEKSNICTPDEDELHRRSLRSDTLFLEIPDAYHHVMIDQPLALLCAIRAVAAGWAVASHRAPF